MVTTTMIIAIVITLSILMFVWIAGIDKVYESTTSVSYDILQSIGVVSATSSVSSSEDDSNAKNNSA